MKDQKMLVEYFKKNNGVLRFTQIIRSGFHPDVLKSLEKKGRIGKIGRGIYNLINAAEVESDIVRAILQAEKGVICLISALSYYEAAEEIPSQVNIAIKKGAWANKIEFPPVKYYQFAPKQWETGIEEHKIEGYKIKIYSLAKTVADCFKFRNRIGMDVARKALKAAVSEKNVKPLEILNYAKICRVAGVIKPLLEAII